MRAPDGPEPACESTGNRFLVVSSSEEQGLFLPENGTGESALSRLGSCSYHRGKSLKGSLMFCFSVCCFNLTPGISALSQLI